MKVVYKKYAVTAVLVWAGCAVVFGVIYMLVMSSRVAMCSAVRDDLEQKKEEYKFAVDASRAGNRQQVNEELGNLRKKLNDFVAGREEAANLTFAISRLAQERNIPSPSVKDRDKGTKSALDDCVHIWKKGVVVEFKSGFPQFFSMLHAVESHQPVMFVETFSIIPGSNDDTENTVKLDISVLAREKQDG